MKKIFGIIFSLFITSPFFFAQEQLESSLLWEITGKKVKSPSYIFGTIHLIPKDDFYFPESLKNKVNESEILVMEIGGISEQMKMGNLLMLDTGEVFDFFSRAQLDSLFSYTSENLGYDEEKLRLYFGKMKPFVLLQIFSQNQFGESPESYELTLEKIAKEKNIAVIGLETVEEQMGFFDKLGNEYQVEMIMQMVREGNKDNNEVRELIDSYLSQDVETIYSVIANSDMNSLEFEDNLLTSRNIKWIPKIKKIIRKNKAFIAVGAGHLGGENGVLKLLREQGYTLKPIKL